MAVAVAVVTPPEASEEQAAAVREPMEPSTTPRQERRTRVVEEAEAISMGAAQEQQADRGSSSCAIRMFIRI